jgi:hypothetical protein
VSDYVEAGERNCYIHDVKTKDKELLINLVPYSGNPDLYVHQKEMPPKLENAAFQSVETFSREELVITPSLRKDQNQLTGPYEICVHALMASSYRIKVKEENH